MTYTIEKSVEEMEQEEKALQWHKMVNEAAMKAALLRHKQQREYNKRRMARDDPSEKAEFLRAVVEDEEAKPFIVSEPFLLKVREKFVKEDEVSRDNFSRKMERLKRYEKEQKEKERRIKRYHDYRLKRRLVLNGDAEKVVLDKDKKKEKRRIAASKAKLAGVDTEGQEDSPTVETAGERATTPDVHEKLKDMSVDEKHSVAAHKGSGITIPANVYQERRATSPAPSPARSIDADEKALLPAEWKNDKPTTPGPNYHQRYVHEHKSAAEKWPRLEYTRRYGEHLSDTLKEMGKRFDKLNQVEDRVLKQISKSAAATTSLAAKYDLDGTSSSVGLSPIKGAAGNKSLDDGNDVDIKSEDLNNEGDLNKPGGDNSSVHSGPRQPRPVTELASPMTPTVKPPLSLGGLRASSASPTTHGVFPSMHFIKKRTDTKPGEPSQVYYAVKMKQLNGFLSTSDALRDSTEGLSQRSHRSYDDLDESGMPRRRKSPQRQQKKQVIDYTQEEYDMMILKREAEKEQRKLREERGDQIIQNWLQSKEKTKKDRVSKLEVAAAQDRAYLMERKKLVPKSLRKGKKGEQENYESNDELEAFNDVRNKIVLQKMMASVGSIGSASDIANIKSSIRSSTLTGRSLNERIRELQSGTGRRMSVDHTTPTSSPKKQAPLSPEPAK
eukprot:GFYU01011938.1.p1 GENE.GFYU01011938.1~~GFYU01011938.1.p1  ORF type:complete len:668 (-),score=198.64 GFYU01011938.1:17-2020(-)